MARKEGMEQAVGSSRNSSDYQLDALPPLMIEPQRLNGRHLTIRVGNFLVIPTDLPWRADTTPSEIVRFTPGGKRGSYEANSGFEGVSPGTVAITLSTPGQKAIEFNITVTTSDDTQPLPKRF